MSTIETLFPGNALIVYEDKNYVIMGTFNENANIEIYNYVDGTSIAFFIVFDKNEFPIS